MSGIVHFKFKSSRSFDQISIVGNVIKVYDLKVAIVEKKKLSQGLDFDLILTNADTKIGAVRNWIVLISIIQSNLVILGICILPLSSVYA